MLVNKIKQDLSCYTSRSGFISLVWAIAFSPGFLVVFLYRLAVFFREFGVLGRLISRLFWRLIVFTSGCYFSLSSEIGPGLFLPHPIGIVVGDDAVIHANVTIYQNVTLGRGSDGGYPEVFPRATIYAGAVLIGRIVIGEGSVIGANSFLNRNTEDFGVYAGVPARSVRQYKECCNASKT